MLARLGQVIYWAANVIAGLIGFVGVLAIVGWITTGNAGEGRFGTLIVAFLFALMVWLIGRACLYILADR